MKIQSTIRKRFHLKTLAAAVSLLIPTMAIQASDLEIYKGKAGGGGTVIMTLDTSTSMKYTDCGGIDDEDFNYTIKLDSGVSDGNTVKSSLQDCKFGSLQKYLIKMLADPQVYIGPEYLHYKLGIATFFRTGTQRTDSVGGRMNHRAVTLNYEGRKSLINEISSLGTESNEGQLYGATTATPLANAYADAAAYLLGTTTLLEGKKYANATTGYVTYEKVRLIRLSYRNNRPTSSKPLHRYVLYQCDTKSTTNWKTLKGVKFRPCEAATPIRVIEKEEAVTDWNYSDGWENINDESTIGAWEDPNFFDISEVPEFDRNKQRIEEDNPESPPRVAPNNDDYLEDSGWFPNKRYYNAGVKSTTLEGVYYFLQNQEDADGEAGPNALSSSNSGVKYLQDKANSKLRDELLTGGNYISPMGNASCQGYGVYIMTDGIPNNSSQYVTPAMMTKALDGKATIGDKNGYCEIPDNFLGLQAGEVDYKGWSCMAEFAKKLHGGNNPANISIPTATAGLGKEFESLDGKKKEITLYNKDGTPKIDDVTGLPIKKKIFDCYKTSNASARNICMLGQKTYGYGEGGFTYATDGKDIAENLAQFFKDVDGGEIGNLATGFMSVPVDQLNTLQSRGDAYLPTLVASPDIRDLWHGNLKKYKVKGGIVVGDDTNNSPVFESNGQFTENTHDVWNTIEDDTRPDALRPDKGKIQVGGTYQHIFENSSESRNLHVDVDGKLLNLQVTKSGSNFKTINFDELGSATQADDPINIKKRQLLKFMGYQIADDLIVTDSKEFAATIDKFSKKMGGVLHSSPKLVTTKINLKEGKFDNDTREDYVLYGSMDGALHLVDDKTGNEIFNFIPNQLLTVQPEALSAGGAEWLEVPFGVDAPWNIYVSYQIKGDDSNKVYKPKQMLASGGLRMGGSMYYSLDLTDIENPELVYSVGSNYAETLMKNNTESLKGIKSGGSVAGKETEAFARFGQTWGEPSVATVKVGGENIVVNLLSGGYDYKYEKADYQPTTSAPAQGNAIFMVKLGNEETDETASSGTEIELTDSGDLLWWTSNTGSDVVSGALKYTQHDDMIHSVVTRVQALDRNYDGLTDHLYYADLGGQVWRVDIDNNKDTDDFKVDRVVKVLDVSARAGSDKVAPKFYEEPLITFDRINYGQSQPSKIVAQITVGSGNRSLPVTAQRAAATSDALYSFIDKDMSRIDLFTNKSKALETEELTIEDLQKLSVDSIDATLQTSIETAQKEGWYYPLNSWILNPSAANPTVLTDQKGIKMLNKPDAIGGFLYVPKYNPNISNTSGECRAGIIGASQVEQLCLPYGACGAGQTAINMGVGIVDSILTQVNPDSEGDSVKLGILKTSCEDGSNDCVEEVICPEGSDCSSWGENIVSPDDAKFGTVNNDHLLNPLNWWERD